MLASKLLMTAGGEEKQYIDDIFSAWTYTGNGSTQTITNGIDLAGKGGMVWAKARSITANQTLFDTERGVSNGIYTNTTGAQTGVIANYGVTAFNSNGFSIGGYVSGDINTSAATHVSWTFRNARNFFQVLQVTKSAGSNLVIDLSPYMTTPGMVKVKRTDAAGSWYVWHRSLSAGQLLIGESTAAAATLGQITVVGTTLTLVNGVIADGTYHVEAYAHDTSADGLIQCGSFTTDAGGNATVNLGWEPQFLLTKCATDPGFAKNWSIYDTSRGWTANATGNVQNNLEPNTANPESMGNTSQPNATGFTATEGISTQTFIYLAIRRSNKPPTTGTQVYNAIARTGTGAAATVTGVGFAPDLVFSKRNNGGRPAFYDKLRGAFLGLNASASDAERLNYDSLTSYTNSGITAGPDRAMASLNYSGLPYSTYFFKRAPGFHSEICYTGTGISKNEVHDLGKAPDLIIVKSRSSTNDWNVWCNGLAGTEKLALNSTAAKVTDTTAWNSTQPTSSVISLGTAAGTNANTTTYVAYLFSNIAGIQSIGTYVGDGTSGRLINCGFTTGSRYVLIKALTATGPFLVADSVRGITSGNDPYLALNSTDAEVTTEDWLDPTASGFLVNQVAASNANVNGVTYMYWSIS